MNDSALGAAFGIELLHIFLFFKKESHLIISNFSNYFNGIQTQNSFFFR